MTKRLNTTKCVQNEESLSELPQTVIDKLLKDCKTPMQTFLDSKHIALEKSCDILMGKSDSFYCNTTKTVS